MEKDIFCILILNKFYKGEENAIKYKRLFHAYLLIKEKFRDELVQINGRTGFANFADYQERKSYFLDKAIYKKAVLNMAVNSSIKDQQIESLEARIAPSNSFIKLDGEIREIENAICDKRYFDIRDFTSENFDKKVKRIKAVDGKLFYVIHFIKSQDSYKLYTSEKPFFSVVRPRNFKVRKGLKSNANAIINLRNSNLSSK